MITAILGRAGAGKSYESVRWVLRELERGRVVITTLPLRLDAERWKDYLADERLVVRAVRDDAGVCYGARAEHWTEWCDSRHQRQVGDELTGPLVILDEAVYVFGGWDKNTEADRIREVIATHRHHLLDLVWVAQVHGQIPVDLKKQVEQWIELTSGKSVGVAGAYAWKVFTTWYGMREPVDSGFRRYDKKVYELYDSHALGGGAGASHGEKGAVFAKRPWWLQWHVALLAGGLGFGVWFGPDAATYVYGWLTGDGLAVGPVAGGGPEADPRREAGERGPPAAPAGVPPRVSPGGPQSIGLGELIEPGAPAALGLPGPEVGFVGRVGERLLWSDGTSIPVLALRLVGGNVREAGVCRLVIEGPGFVGRWGCGSSSEVAEQE